MRFICLNKIERINFNRAFVDLVGAQALIKIFKVFKVCVLLTSIG